jgi:asparagine synthase (glutamine-hydrolysing)
LSFKENESNEDYINKSLYFEAKTFLHGFLIVEDKVSMAHSLEGRLPFLDNDLVDFATSIPVRFKLKNLNKTVKIDEDIIGKIHRYYLISNDGKNILRKAMKGLIPDKVLTREKQGFSAIQMNLGFEGKASIMFEKFSLTKGLLIEGTSSQNISRRYLMNTLKPK